jgi:hypothetical protein
MQYGNTPPSLKELQPPENQLSAVSESNFSWLMFFVANEKNS